MSNIKEALKLIGGTEPTPEQIQRIQAIAHALDIPAHDAMFPILVALDSYHGIFTRLPDEVAKKNKESADDSATNAAERAQNKVNEAVAELVPSISGTLAAAASSAVRQKQLGRSMLTIWGALVIIGFVFSFGWFFGAHALRAALSRKFPWPLFWANAGQGIGLGMISPTLIMLGGVAFVDSKGNPTTLGWITLSGGVICGIVLIVRVWNS